MSQTYPNLVSKRSGAGRLVWIGLLLFVLIPGFLFLFPQLQTGLEFQRSAITKMEYWRLITAQFTHWTTEHLFWNAFTTLILWFVCLRIELTRNNYVQLTLIWVLIPLSIWCFMPNMQHYRGLSGFSSALFALALCHSWKASTRILRTLITLIVMGFMAKLVYEQFQEAAFFAGASDLFIPTPLTHLTGFIGGIWVYCSHWSQRAKTLKTQASPKQSLSYSPSEEFVP